MTGTFSEFFDGALATAAWTQIWQVTVVALLVALTVRLACRHRPHLAHTLWLLLLIKCVTPPLWSSETSVFSHVGDNVAGWLSGESPDPRVDVVGIPNSGGSRSEIDSRMAELHPEGPAVMDGDFANLSDVASFAVASVPDFAGRNATPGGRGLAIWWGSGSYVCLVSSGLAGSAFARS